MRHCFPSTRWLALALALSLMAVACRGKDDAAPRDWRPVMEHIDVELVLQVMEAHGWKLSGEPTTMTMTADEVRSMGGQAAGDTSFTSHVFEREGLTASVTFIVFPGDVKPATGDRGISMEEALLAAGPRSVGVTVYDKELSFQKDASVALLDAVIEAAEKRQE